MNLRMKNNANSTIFTKSVNNKYKLIPFNVRNNSVGDTRYSPATSKEWKNTVYFFNYNNMKNLPYYDISINKLINGYFNLYFNNKAIIGKFISSKSKRLSLNKIFVSKAEVKHTNSKAIITIYTYNREEIVLLKKIKLLKRSFFTKVFLFFSKSTSLYKNISKDISNKLFKFMLYKELVLIRRLKLKLNLNKYKFEENLLNKLGKLLSKFYNKKVEFNIINLKSMVLNSDIFTEVLALKLRNRKTNVIKMMDYVLAKAILPKVNRIKEKGSLIKSVNLSLLENKYKNININSIVNKNNLDEIISEGTNTLNIEDNGSDNYSNIHNAIFNDIKYKNMGGVRLEAKGRLTKRYRADRAILKIRWKGGLKNIDSSYKGLSAVNLRGYMKPNMEYSLYTTKRRIGAFAIKGWVSGK